MKKNFKKLMSLALVVVMLSSIFCISASAATYTVTLKGGTRKINGETYTAYLNETLLNLAGNTYTDENGAVYTIDKEAHTITFSTDASGYVTFPEHFFVLTGHTQSAWGTSATSNGSATYKEGRRLKITGNKTYYPRFDTIKYTAEFLPGTDGEGASQTISNKTYGASVTLPEAIFTREGYVQIGWSHIENSPTVDFELNDATFKITDNVKFYPVWQKIDVNVAYDVNKFSFGSVCVGYVTPDAQVLTLTNLGNAAVNVKLPESEIFELVSPEGTTIAANGGKLSILIQPKAGVGVGKYTEALFFDFGDEDVNFSVTVKFSVNDHLFVKYIYNNDATYIADGTETAECFSGCGATFDRTAEGTKKIYSADSNTADGLMKEYLYHKTVKFVAYGSGMDANPAKGDTLSKRFRPTEWSVADTAFGGTFDANTTDYTVMYDHGDGNFGTYTLTIKYVEEEKNADGEWVATGIEDVKNFKYSIGPSEKDNQEVVRPNMIVSIIFGLFGYLIDLLTSGSLF